MSRLIIAVAILLLVACAEQEDSARQSPIDVRLGIAAQPTSALMIIAHEQGFFADQGLRVVETRFPSGKRALRQGLFKGQVDVVSTAGVPATLAMFERKDFRILSTLYNTDNNNRIVARRDVGIGSPDDLRGRRIGTQFGSAVHYFEYLFLNFHGIAPSQVQARFMKAEQLPAALASGEIDAFSMREPYVSTAVTALGDNAIVFAEPGLYDQVDVLVISTAALTDKPELAPRLMQALLQAESFAHAHPEASAEIVAGYLRAPLAAIKAAWPNYRFRVELDQSLIALLEDEALWAIDSQVVESAQIPNVLDFLYTPALAKSHPERVRLGALPEVMNRVEPGRRGSLAQAESANGKDGRQ